MNENLDLTKILDGCPGGTQFYSSIYGDVYFIRVYPTAIYPNVDNYPIELVSCTKALKMHTKVWVTKEGLDKYNFNGECTLFPSKDQRDWSKFKRFWDKSEVEESKVEKFDINTLQPFDKVLVRDFLSDNWMADFFERIDENDVHYNATCVTSHWEQCIPYNDETKHLLGTREDCPDYYKWWEK